MRYILIWIRFEMESKRYVNVRLRSDKDINYSRERGARSLIPKLAGRRRDTSWLIIVNLNFSVIKVSDLIKGSETGRKAAGR